MGVCAHRLDDSFNTCLETSTRCRCLRGSLLRDLIDQRVVGGGIFIICEYGLKE